MSPFSDASSSRFLPDRTPTTLSSNCYPRILERGVHDVTLTLVLLMARDKETILRPYQEKPPEAYDVRIYVML